MRLKSYGLLRIVVESSPLNDVLSTLDGCTLYSHNHFIEYSHVMERVGVQKTSPHM